jgi:hypothetical protein
VSSKSHGFVALSSLRKPSPTAEEALGEIRRIYFRTKAKTIEHDLAHAISLLKTVGDEAMRDKAAVYMDGLAELRTEWRAGLQTSGGAAKRPSASRATPPRRPRGPKKPKG